MCKHLNWVRLRCVIDTAESSSVKSLTPQSLTQLWYGRCRGSKSCRHLIKVFSPTERGSFTKNLKLRGSFLFIIKLMRTQDSCAKTFVWRGSKFTRYFSTSLVFFFLLCRLRDINDPAESVSMVALTTGSQKLSLTVNCKQLFQSWFFSSIANVLFVDWITF